MMIVVVSERGLERALEAFAEMFEEVMATTRRREYSAALARPQFAPVVQRVRAGGVREPHDRRTDLRNRRPTGCDP